MIHKAAENVEAGNILLGWDYLDSAANRFYYGLYLAGWAFMVGRGHQVPLRHAGRYFPHTIDRDLENEGFGGLLGLPSDWREVWDEVRNCRLKADYSADSVNPDDLGADLIAFVEKVVSEAEMIL